MDIRLEGQHEIAMQRLQKHYDEKTATTIVRRLIYRDAKELGLWPESSEAERTTDISDPREALTQ